jgi:hypothetical protein
MNRPNYISEHTLFTFQPTDDADYEVWEDMDIGKKVTQYTEWFKKNKVNPKKYNFKKYVNPPLADDWTAYVTVQIYDRKIDTLFRLTWL